jgi:hypothetical protein
MTIESSSIYKKYKKNTKYELLKPITLAKGEVFDSGPHSITMGEKHYELIIGLGDDHIIRVLVAESAIKDSPEFFGEISTPPKNKSNKD